MKCIYHNDLDGKCAAHWVHRNVSIHDNDIVKWTPDSFGISIDYKDKFPFDKIQPNEQVWIVDFSLSLDDMRKLLSITKDVTWIDHHKTAIEKYKDFEHEIRGVRYDGYAGCELTYAYIHKMTQRGDGDIKEFTPSMLDDAPMFTKYVGDWDTWKFKYGDDTKRFKVAVESYDCSPASDVWLQAEEDVSKFINEGKIIERYKNEHWKDIVNSFSFFVSFEGYKGIACNAGKVNSTLFDSIKEEYDIMLPFYFDGEKYTVSCYTKKDNIDCSEIAKKYGGGGHRQAAGFQCFELPFKKEAV